MESKSNFQSMGIILWVYVFYSNSLLKGVGYIKLVATCLPTVSLQFQLFFLNNFYQCNVIGDSCNYFLSLIFEFDRTKPIKKSIGK